MAKNLKALLEQKLAVNSQRHAEAHQDTDFDVGRQHIKLHLELIDQNPYQPRQSFPQAELEALASSILELGLLQPISVRQVGNRYQLIAGERRLRAHKLLGYPSIEAIVIPVTDAEMAVLALAENIDRADLSDYEIGKALRQIENQFPSKTRLAESVGLNREDMYRYFAYEALPDHIRVRLDKYPRLLSRSAAADIKRVLQSVDPALAREILDAGWRLLEGNEIDQTKLAAWLLREIKARQDQVPAGHDKAKPIEIARAGKRVGTLACDEKKLVLKLNANVLTEGQAERLRSFVLQLVAEQL